MEFKKVLEARRSVRKFTPQEVPDAVIESLLGQAMRAPSSRNTRSTRFLVVKDREKMARIAAMRDYGSAFVADAPAAIVVAGDRTAGDLWLDNAAISATVLLLAAVDAGLKGCWVHVNGRPRVKDRPEGEQAADYLRSFLPIPEEWSPLCVVALGYSDFEPRPLPDCDDSQRIVWCDRP